MSPVVYQGKRDAQGTLTVTKQIDEYPPKALDMRMDLRCHSDAPEVGYSGSGPAQLSLAILADVMGEWFAEAYHQKYKRQVIAAIPREGNFAITAEAVEAWAEEIIQKERGISE